MVGQAGSEGLHGPRLEFVARKLKGTVSRTRHIAPPTQKQREKDETPGKDLGVESEQIVEPAGYMIFMPTGQCYRLSEEAFIKQHFDREPAMIGYEQVNDNKSPMGRFKMARTEATRDKAYREMEEQVIFACTKGLKDYRAFIADYDPNGKLPEDQKVAA